MLAAASLELKAEKQGAHGSEFVAFSPDGKSIVSGSDADDKSLKVWDAGASPLTPPQPLSPDLTAPVLAAASLELKAEKQSAHSHWVTSVAFSPDGKTIVSGSFDRSLKVWDAGLSALTPSKPLSPNLTALVLVVASLELKAQKQKAHSRFVASVAFSPDGKTIVSGSCDNAIKVWNAGVDADAPKPLC